MSREQSLLVPRTANGQSIAVSTATAQSAALDFTDALVTSTVDCFVVAGANPVATTACAFIPANTPLRLYGWKLGEKLAFITASGSGTVYLTPGG